MGPNAKSLPVPGRAILVPSLSSQPGTRWDGNGQSFKYGIVFSPPEKFSRKCSDKSFDSRAHLNPASESFPDYTSLKLPEIRITLNLDSWNPKAFFSLAKF